MSLVSRESVVRGLGITTALDGSNNQLVNIPKFPNYEMPTVFLEEECTNVDSDDDDSASSLSERSSDNDETTNDIEDEVDE